MPDRSLDRLARAGLLEPKKPDRHRVRTWLDRSRQDLELAGGSIGDIYRERAMAIAYQAGYRACAGVLDLAGYRVTSQPGHHRTAIDAATVVLRPGSRSLLRRLDRARRYRNETLYGDAPKAGVAEFEQLLKDVAWLLGQLEQRLST